MIPHDTHLQIGSLLFEGLDQIDLTGPFEVLSRIPNSTYRIYGKTAEPVRDLQGPAADAGCGAGGRAATRRAARARRLWPGGADGGRGVLGWIREQAAGARSVFSVCTGALLCGAAGLLKGRRATTHWASFHLLPLFGAMPVDERVVVDGNWVFAAGVTAGIDGALRLAAELRGDEAAQAIQLYMVYAPEPPFDSGTPETAPARSWRQRERRRSRHHRPARGDRPRRSRRPARHPTSRTTRRLTNPHTTFNSKETEHDARYNLHQDRPAGLATGHVEGDRRQDLRQGHSIASPRRGLQPGRRRLARPRGHPHNLRQFIDKGFTATTTSSNTSDSPLLKVFHGKVR